jgi:hypothetical protein
VDRITQSLLADFSREHNLDSLKESERFEHFASYITVRRQYSETFDTSEIVTGSGGDTGIDAVAILVNGSLITDIESFRELAEKTGHLDVMFVFVQADRGASFESAKIGTFLFGVQDFFRDQRNLNEMR